MFKRRGLAALTGRTHSVPIRLLTLKNGARNSRLEGSNPGTAHFEPWVKHIWLRQEDTREYLSSILIYRMSGMDEQVRRTDCRTPKTREKGGGEMNIMYCNKYQKYVSLRHCEFFK